MKLRSKERNDEEEAVLQKLNHSIILVSPTVNSFSERNKWLKDPQIIFIEKLVEILPANMNQDLDFKIKRANISYGVYVNHMFNVVESMKKNRDEMNRVIANIKVLAKPLDLL